MNEYANSPDVPFPSFAGSWTEPKYRSRVGKDGEIELVEDGYIDYFALTQAGRDAADVNNIVARFQAGDLNALQQAQGVYMDATKLPSTRQEMLQQVIDVQRQFEELPIDVREKFGNSFEKYFVTAGSSDWLNIMAPVFGIEIKSDSNKSDDK